MIAVGKAQVMVLDFDGLNRPEGRIHFELGDFQKAFDGPWDLSESVFELLSHLTDRLDVLQAADAAVNVDFVPHVLNVFGWQIGFDRQLDIDIKAEFQRGLGHLPNGLVEQLAVQFVSDCGDMAALLGS